MENGRITAITNYINATRNPENIVGKAEQIKETGEMVAYFEKYNGSMQDVYENICQDTKKIKLEKRELADRQTRDARSDSEDLGIGIEY